MMEFAPVRSPAILPASVLVALAQERSALEQALPTRRPGVQLRAREIDRLIRMDAEARGMAAARPVAPPARADNRPLMYLPPVPHWRTVPLVANAPGVNRQPAPVMAANRPPAPHQFAPITPHWQAAPTSGALAMAANGQRATNSGGGGWWAETERVIRALQQR